MITRLPLRWRVALAYGLIGFALSLGFAVATTFIAEDYEHILLEALLKGQGENYLDRIVEDPAALLPASRGYSAFREADAPIEFQGHEPGIHEPDIPGREGVHFAVFGEPGARLVVVMDVGEVETLEEYLFQIMVLIVALGTAASGWVGWMLARYAVRPVSQLAQAVRELPVRPVATRLVSEFSQDELGELAAAIDAYQLRLADAASTESAFFANANHELRTPITVIQGAIEVMREDANVLVSQRSRLDRVDRAIMELAVLLEALMLAAKGVPKELEPIKLREALDDALQRVAGVYPASAQLAVVDDGEPKVVAPRRWVDCILTLLIQRVLSRAPNKSWHITVFDDRITLNESGRSGPMRQLVERSDLGLGLMFVEKLCRGLGWTLTQGHDADAQLCIEMRISSSENPATNGFPA